MCDRIGCSWSLARQRAGSETISSVRLNLPRVHTIRRERVRQCAEDMEFRTIGEQVQTHPPYSGGAGCAPAIGSLHPPAALCGLRRDHEPLSERMQGRFDLAYMRAVIRVDEAPDRALGDPQPFGKRSVSDAFRAHRAVEG